MADLVGDQKGFTMGKLSFIVGMAAGYVLGARAGRPRYEQIKTRAGKVWSSEPVQSKVGDVSAAARTKAAPFVADVVSDAARNAGHRMRGGDEQLPPTLHRGTDGRLHADTTGFGPGPGKLP